MKTVNYLKSKQNQAAVSLWKKPGRTEPALVRVWHSGMSKVKYLGLTVYDLGVGAWSLAV